MTVKEAIDYADLVKPNAIPQSVKLRWLSQLEGRIAAEIFLMSAIESRTYVYDENKLGYELLIYPPHDDIYTSWLEAQIDLANGEYDRAANTMQLFDSKWRNFVRWFGNRYDPAQGYRKEAIYLGRWVH